MPRLSGEKYRWRKETRGGAWNLSAFFSNQALSSADVGYARGRDVLGDELHLLRHAALHDGVVLVEAHREALAIQDLLLHLGLDHAAELRRGRVALPLRLEQHRELCKVVDRQLDLP